MKIKLKNLMNKLTKNNLFKKSKFRKKHKLKLNPPQVLKMLIKIQRNIKLSREAKPLKIVLHFKTALKSEIKKLKLNKSRRIKKSQR